ncbi:HAD family hydrolase [Pseudomonas sp. F1_0610]|uniref:HAD family hydrolase n=1 Tax=Pseudomonas sp. F1_0610 TaxID=3114284 RepID=UPI0039C30FC4
MSIKVVSFDLDDTLWAVKPVLTNAEWVLQSWLVENAPLLARNWSLWYQDVRQQLLNDDQSLSFRVSDMRRTLLRICLEKAGYSHNEAVDLAKQGFQVYFAQRQKVQPFADAASVLSKLAEDYKLVAFSNGNANIYTTELGAYFTDSFNAENIGFGKPDPCAFELVQRALAVDAHEIVHVGDQIQDDILGAQQAGWFNIWYNPQQQLWSGQQKPTAEITALTELPLALHHLQAY